MAIALLLTTALSFELAAPKWCEGYVHVHARASIDLVSVGFVLRSCRIVSVNIYTHNISVHVCVDHLLLVAAQIYTMSSRSSEALYVE
jgi:hypothetical protein